MKKFKPYNPIKEKEINAAIKVLKTGKLSGFLGEKSTKFYGGPEVLKFEENCKKFFKVKYAISVNSWTSGLICSVGALGLNPGDEVIVSPWTMCATATAIIHYNAIPIFCDIEYDTFNLNHSLIEKKITRFTKAIIITDIFGKPCNYTKIMKIAKKYNLKVISDNAQSPGAIYKKKFSCTIADIGGISLNYHKHINTGEGGVIFTNNKVLAKKIQLIRNHGEAVVKPNDNLINIVGHNFRLGEVESAIGSEQIKRLKKILDQRIKIANKLITKLKVFKELTLPDLSKNYSNVFYIIPIILSDNLLRKISRIKLLKKLENYGLKGFIAGYTNLHLLPMYQKKIAYGDSNFPWSLRKELLNLNYSKGICPVAEQLNDKNFLGFEICVYELDDIDINNISNIFEKIWKELKIY